MVQPLQPHPRTSGGAVEAIAAEAERDGARLTLRYVLTGDVGALVLPAPAPPRRADRLWEHSCFEAFVRASADPGYFELNLAPSGAWAAYRFGDYRMDMAIAENVPPPRIATRRGERRFELTASVDLGAAMGLLDHLPWHLALAAVIEEESGGRTYWALAHPPGDPDFHHEDCFGLELPPSI